MTRETRSALIVIPALVAYLAATPVTTGQQSALRGNRASRGARGPAGSGDQPGVEAVTVYSTGDIAVAIPDNAPAGVDIPITVFDAITIADVNVSFRLNHTFDGDLQISLVHPDSTVVPLVTNRGGSGANFGSGANSSAGTPTVIDDAASNPISSGAVPFAGSFRPESPLSVLNGKPSDGTWILRIVDTAALDVGTVGVFNLHLTCCAVINAAPPVVFTAEGVSPPNNVADPNETVTVNLPLVNVGARNTSNLVATLQPTGGVTSPSGAQSYGVVVAGGAAVARPYTFTASGICGGPLTLTLLLVDGVEHLGAITYTLMLGTPFPAQTFTNAGAIEVPATPTTTGVANPYPSDIAVAGVPGVIAKLTVGLKLVNHAFPDDIDVLLVSPSGQKMIIMSDTGGNPDAVNLQLVFDDSAAAALPDQTQIVSGTFRPTDVLAGDTFAAPAPTGPYLSPAPIGTETLGSAFNGLAPNGTWSLYATDDFSDDAGNFNGGWELVITPTGGTCLTATAPDAPIGATAIARNTRATVSFTPPALNGGSLITGYTVTSNPAGGVDINAGTTALSHLVTGLSNGLAYTFTVQAINMVGTGAASTPSNSVIPPGFTDFLPKPTLTTIKAVHIIELRQRIDAMRVQYFLGPYPWSDATLTPGTTTIQAVHIADLRTALAAVYVAAGVTPLPSYTDPVLGAGTVIRAVHIAQLRAAVVAIEP